MGTINTIVITNRELTTDAMVWAVIVTTEAKSAALFDLTAKSVVAGSHPTPLTLTDSTRSCAWMKGSATG